MFAPQNPGEKISKKEKRKLKVILHCVFQLRRWFPIETIWLNILLVSLLRLSYPHSFFQLEIMEIYIQNYLSLL